MVPQICGNQTMKKVVSTPEDAAAMIRAALPKEQKEERVFVLPLDAHGKVLARPILVSVGSEDGTTVIDAGAIFREALKAGAEEIIVAHNHPSGDPTPSRADIAATKELRALASQLGVPLVDHIIMGSSRPASSAEFVSLAESGRLDGICMKSKSVNIKGRGKR